MPKRFLRRILPDQSKLQKNRFLARFAPWFAHPNLWHVNRRSIAGGVAVGMIGGLIPGPLQIITASLLALFFRVNLPVAVVTTFYTNPLTIGPLYWLAVKLGSFLTGLAGADKMPPMPGFFGYTLGEWLGAMWHWFTSLGMPLLVGLPTLAVLLAIAGYVLVQLGWRAHVLWSLWRRRRARRVR
ncbi:DUF2062 domain-containing protein [Andreprevotia chitinilytica]|uniref:DUF2062 domain-containing protein n=1 Tax=Andreprevotia chitinilytica TaxID=396808 RepID=UPI00055271B4|nr:DUF2062 domain-containing protein [Andreprevotia chitinilytica]